MTLSPLFQCVCWLSFVVSPPLLPSVLPYPPFPPFIRRAGSGVTNYSERAEKVVWALPSGLPCCIIIREIAGTLQPLAAGTTATTSAPALGHIDSVRFKLSSCLIGWLALGQPPLLLTCWAELICMSRHPGNSSTWKYTAGHYVCWLIGLFATLPCGLDNVCDASKKVF